MRTNVVRLLITSAAILSDSSLAVAGTTKSWRRDTAADFAAGKLSRVVVTSEGTVQLSRQIQPLAEIKAAQLWSLVSDAHGNLYAATGNPGSIVRIGADGKTTVLFEKDDQQIFDVVVAPDGRILAGASPGGTVLQIAGDGKARPLFETKQTYIWALAVDAAGNVYAATGDAGKLFRINPQGQGQVVFDARQPHLLSLALSPSGEVYLGTDKDGIVYRVAPNGQAYVLYDAPQADIHSLLLAADGVLFAGTGTPRRPTLSPGGSSSSSALSAAAGLANPTSPVGEGVTTKAQPVDTESGSSTPATRRFGSSISSSSNSSPATPAGQNAVFRITSDGAAEEVFRQPALVLGLALCKDKLLVGTGQEGRLFEVDPATRLTSEIARLEHGQINGLVRCNQGKFAAAASSPSKVYNLEDRFAASGTITSEVHDAAMQSRWGKAVATAQAPPNTTLQLEYRTGNIAEPDDTWSGWVADPAQLPVGRFLQYRASLASPAGEATPSLTDITVYYTTVNQAPRLESIEVPDAEKSPVPSPASKLKFTWKASDPNGDSLSYILKLRKEGWPEWVTLADETTKTEFEWDPGSLPGGQYQVQVAVTDSPSNRQEEARSASKTSARFALDRQAPAVKIAAIKVAERKLQIQAEAADESTRLTAAEISIDGKPWLPLYPADGVFDDRNEKTSYQTDDLSPGLHVVMVRFRDSAGHLGVADGVGEIKGQ